MTDYDLKVALQQRSWFTLHVVDNLPLLLAKIPPAAALPQCLVNLLFPVVHAREIVARHYSKLQLIDTWLHEHSTLFCTLRFAPKARYK